MTRKVGEKMTGLSSNEPLLTVNEVLEKADISRWTLHKDTEAGRIKAIHFGKNVRYRKSDVEEYIVEKNLIRGVTMQGDVKYYTIKDLMTKFQVSRYTIYRAIQSGKLVITKKAGNRQLFSEEAVNNYLELSERERVE